MLTIKTIRKNSIAAKLGLLPGDKILRIDGEKLLDNIDFRFRFTEEFLNLECEINGQTQNFELEKNYDEELGVEFEDFKIFTCANDCVFCFAQQNPPSVRPELNFKDGDYRMSFLYGHYITTSNLGQRALNRIVEQHMSPLYISVHTTNPKLREGLILKKRDDNFMAKMEFMAKGGIQFHCQIVLMPEENDGAELLRSIRDLSALGESVLSLSIVPVGLTAHRQGLFALKSITDDYSRNMLKFFENRILPLRKELNFAAIFLSDEWYIRAGEECPQVADLDGLDLSENGVGQVAQFLAQFEEERAEFPKSFEKPRTITIGTGTLIAPIFREKVLPVLNSIGNLTVNLLPISNGFFGESVTVSGLITGSDIEKQVAGFELGEALWLSNRVLEDGKTRFLDDCTPDELEAKINTKLRFCNDSFLEIFGRNLIE